MINYTEAANIAKDWVADAGNYAHVIYYATEAEIAEFASLIGANTAAISNPGNLAQLSEIIIRMFG